jgi:exo-beta-1,3-glucanase (GH17 family)
MLHGNFLAVKVAVLETGNPLQGSQPADRKKCVNNRDSCIMQIISNFQCFGLNTIYLSSLKMC